MTRQRLNQDPIRDRLIHPHHAYLYPYGTLVFRKEWWKPLVAHDTLTDYLNLFPRCGNPMRNTYLRPGRGYINEKDEWMRLRGKHYHIFSIPRPFPDDRLECARDRPLALLNHIHPQYHPV